MRIFLFEFSGRMEIAAHCNEDAMDAFKDACAEVGIVIETFAASGKPDLGIV